VMWRIAMSIMRRRKELISFGALANALGSE
jgi:hypothetical protein